MFVKGKQRAMGLYIGCRAGVHNGIGRDPNAAITGIQVDDIEAHACCNERIQVI